MKIIARTQNRVLLNPEGFVGGRRMKQEMKYKLRRLAAATILLVLFIAFTTSVLIKAIDADFQRQDVILEQHFKDWGIEK